MEIVVNDCLNEEGCVLDRNSEIFEFKAIFKVIGMLCRVLLKHDNVDKSNPTAAGASSGKSKMVNNEEMRIATCYLRRTDNVDKECDHAHAIEMTPEMKNDSIIKKHPKFFCEQC